MHLFIDDWVSDGLLWFNNGANKELPSAEPLIYKSYFDLNSYGVAEKRFQKIYTTMIESHTQNEDKAS